MCLKTMSEKRFLDHIYEGYKVGKRYCFVLGAGASRTSGIRTGEQLMEDWIKYLYNKERGIDYIRECAQELDLQNSGEKYKRFLCKDYKPKNEDYFDLFDLRFASKPEVGYSFLEHEMEGKYPSYGYFPLASLLSNTENRLVITTNFDSLIEDSIFIYTAKHPLVVGHESLASYISNDFNRPVIAKIHRDLYFKPLNREKDMQKLSEEWEEPLSKALDKYTPIIIGYAGGDHTFMSLLEKIKLNTGLYWCYVGYKPSKRICDVVQKHNGYLVKIIGFDEIMFQIGERFNKEANFNDPWKFMESEVKKRYERYSENLEKIKEKYGLQKNIICNTLQDENLQTTENTEIIENTIKQYANRQIGLNISTNQIPDTLLNIRMKLLLGDYEGALKDADKAIILEPYNARYYNSRGIIFHKLSEFESALQDKTKAIELDPYNAEYYNSRGITYHEISEFELALQDKTKAIELEPYNAKYYNSRGITYHEISEFESALQDETKAIELNSNNAEYYNSRGLTLHELSEFESALQDETKAIELDSNNAEYYYSRGIIFHEIEEFESALQDETKAIELDSNNAEYYNSRSITLYKLSEFESALEDETKAIELDSNNSEYYNNRAMTLHELSELESALQDAAKAIELDSNNDKCYYSRAAIFYKQGHFESALQDIDKAINLNPNNAEYYSSRSIILHKLKCYKEALIDKTKAIELEPKGAEYYKGSHIHEVL